jgi:F0F1-type ATP synthase assembly protein I
MQKKQPNQKKNNFSGFEKYAQYSGIAFQMIVVILLFVWIGKKIDQKYFNGENIFIIVFSLMGVGISLYLALKDIMKISGKK